MWENRIRGRVVIEFTQDREGEVHWRLDVDDWIRHWAELKPEAMAIARVPTAVVAARILADLCHGGGIGHALKCAKQAQEKAEAVHRQIEQGKRPLAGAEGDEQDSTVH